MEEYRLSFDNYYISDLGNIKNGEKVLRCSILPNGYKYIQIKRNGKRINKYIHHLVCKAFIGDRPNGEVIDHIDRNKLNNNKDNLRYCSYSDNCRNTDRYEGYINRRFQQLVL
jgi:hypothetical protein